MHLEAYRRSQEFVLDELAPFKSWGMGTPGP